MNYVIGTDEFKKHLTKWLEDSKQEHGEYFFRNREKIPLVFRNYSKPLYRGMIVDDDTLAILKSGKFKFSNYTSWSKNEKIARKFLTKEYATSKKEGHKILLTKIIPIKDQLLDIDGFVSFMGADQLIMMGYDDLAIDSAKKEGEIVINKGIKINGREVRSI